MIKFNGLSETADSEVYVIHISRVTITYIHWDVQIQMSEDPVFECHWWTICPYTYDNVIIISTIKFHSKIIWFAITGCQIHHRLSMLLSCSKSWLFKCHSSYWHLPSECKGKTKHFRGGFALILCSNALKQTLKCRVHAGVQDCILVANETGLVMCFNTLRPRQIGRHFQVTSHYLNQWWLNYRCIYASLGLNELK